MSDLTGADPGPQAEGAPSGEGRGGRKVSEGPPSWLRTSALVVGAALVLIALFVVASAVLPGWWASTIGRQVDGVGSAGVLWGLFYGVVFTLLPLAVVFLAIRPNWHWKTRLIVGSVALVLTAPNLLTLAVAAGTSADTRAARTVMAIEAPNFRLATLIGVIVTLVGGAVGAFLIWRLVASRRELHKLRSESLDRDGMEPAGSAGSADSADTGAMDAAQVPGGTWAKGDADVSSEFNGASEPLVPEFGEGRGETAGPGESVDPAVPIDPAAPGVPPTQPEEGGPGEPRGR